MRARVGFAAPPPLGPRAAAAAAAASAPRRRLAGAARRAGGGLPPRRVGLPHHHPRRGRHPRRSPATASAAQPSDVEPDTVPTVDVAATKRSLLLLAAATDRGYRATPADTAAALALIRALEAATPTPAPTRALDLLCGDWKLLYTTARDVLSLAYLPLSRVGDVYQNILPEGSGVRAENVVRLVAPAVPFFGPRAAESVVSLRVRARCAVLTGSRLGLMFERAGARGGVETAAARWPACPGPASQARERPAARKQKDAAETGLYRCSSCKHEPRGTREHAHYSDNRS